MDFCMKCRRDILRLSAGLLLAMLLPATARAECKSWQLLLGFNAVQANGPTPVFTLGPLVNGKAKGTAYYLYGSDLLQMKGTVDAQFDGYRLTMYVWWGNKAYGKYSGTISQGVLAGTTINLQNPDGTNSEYYWRSKQTFPCADAVAASPKPTKKLGKRIVPGACKPGFVWRVARHDDLVCVTPESRTRAARENQNPQGRWNSAGAYGPQTCVAGLVWRAAFPGDTICVTPVIRDLVAQENAAAASRRQ